MREYPTVLSNLSKKNELLAQLKAKKLTMEEFMKECAYWGVETLDEYVPINHPKYPPQLKDYVAMDDSKKSRVDGSFWWDGDIFECLNNQQRIINENLNNYMWLKEWLSYIPKEDSMSRSKLTTKISEYETFFEINPSRFYKTSHKKPEKNEDISRVLETFGGDIV